MDAQAVLAFKRLRNFASDQTTLGCVLRGEPTDLVELSESPIPGHDQHYPECHIGYPAKITRAMRIAHYYGYRARYFRAIHPSMLWAVRATERINSIPWSEVPSAQQDNGRVRYFVRDTNHVSTHSIDTAAILVGSGTVFDVIRTERTTRQQTSVAALSHHVGLPRDPGNPTFQNSPELEASTITTEYYLPPAPAQADGPETLVRVISSHYQLMPDLLHAPQPPHPAEPQPPADEAIPPDHDILYCHQVIPYTHTLYNYHMSYARWSANVLAYAPQQHVDEIFAHFEYINPMPGPHVDSAVADPHIDPFVYSSVLTLQQQLLFQLSSHPYILQAFCANLSPFDIRTLIQEAPLFYPLLYPYLRQWLHIAGDSIQAIDDLEAPLTAVFADIVGNDVARLIFYRIRTSLWRDRTSPAVQAAVARHFDEWHTRRWIANAPIRFWDPVQDYDDVEPQPLAAHQLVVPQAFQANPGPDQA